jgi:class 3 adenylate cyclase
MDSTTTACPGCGELGDAAQHFCGHCGTSLWLKCASCGKDNPLGFGFCGSCGAPCEGDGSSTPGAGGAGTGAAESEGGERRWVTVMFADLSGFTALSERTDPEEIRSMVDRCMSEMGEVVERFGGSVDKVIGDALMAVFGAPVAHEDDSERAVRAALEIQRRASEEADDFGGLRVSIGVNTGEVIFAPVGPAGRRELTVMGDAVNTAARLQAGAAPETVLVGRETRVASASAITYEAVEPILAKGKEAPLPAWRARAATSAPADRPISAAPFIGRDTELELLLRTWARTSSELHPQLVTLVGAPGIGKTRLTLEFAARVKSAGGRILRGRPLPYGEPAAYWAFGQIIRDACGIFATDSADVAGEKLGKRAASLLPASEAQELAMHLSILARLAEDTVDDRRVLFASAQRFLEALAREQPTLVVLEDLHWADESLLELIEGLSVRLGDVPLLLLALGRPEFLDARPGWARLPTNLTVPLQALTEAHAQDLILRLTSGAPDREALSQRIEQAAAGNPLFIEELAAWLSEGDTANAAGIPANIKTIIAARLDQLPAAERQVILDASVIGDFFWQGTLEALASNKAPGSNEALAELLHALERRGLVRHSPASRIRGDQELSFKHGLVREVAYSTIPKAVRRERHAVVARFIEHAAGDPTAYAVILAHHWREAGDAANAVDYLLIAADQAWRGWTPREAVELCNQALELIPPDDEARRRRARLRRGVAVMANYHVNVDVAPADHAPADQAPADQAKSPGEMSPPIS